MNPQTGQPFAWRGPRYGEHMGQAGKQQQRQAGAPAPQQQPSGQGAQCQHCGARGNHNGNGCWLHEPDKAPAWWAPSPRTPAPQLAMYRERCRVLRVQPKEPGSGVFEAT